MRNSVILAHPDKNSFNHALAHTVIDELKSNGHTIFYHDLYEENFDPILPSAEIPKDVQLPPEIQSHCDEISAAEGLIIIHPNWWGQPPAILKGWVDRVIRPGTAYEFIEEDKGEGIQDLLHDKPLLTVSINVSYFLPEAHCLPVLSPFVVVFSQYFINILVSPHIMSYIS